MANATELESSARAPSPAQDEIGVDRPADAKKTVPATTEYKVLVANTADQVCGSVGGIGDILDEVTLTVPAAATVTIKDGSTTVFSHAFTAAVAIPVTISIKKRSVNGAWKVSTGASMTGFAGGLFS